MNRESRIDRFGVENVREYLENHDLIEGVDYLRAPGIGGNYGTDEIVYLPRINKTLNNKLYDVSDDYYLMDSLLVNSNQKYVWDHVVGVGDYDGDGDDDVLMSGNAQIGNNPNLYSYDLSYSRNAFFFMENQGDGRLNVSIYNYIPEDLKKKSLFIIEISNDPVFQYIQQDKS